MKKTVKLYQIIIFVLIIIICALVYLRYKDNKVVIENRQEPGDTLELMQKNEYALENNDFSKFDFSFLKFENGKKNKIYSPLSIKYAFKMIEEASNVETK